MIFPLATFRIDTVLQQDDSRRKLAEGDPRATF
jgi:hypothetical protein